MTVAAALGMVDATALFSLALVPLLLSVLLPLSIVDVALLLLSHRLCCYFLLLLLLLLHLWLPLILVLITRWRPIS
jgi:hypothetical protein